MAKYETQLCVIAAGPAGLAAAVQAAEDGAEVIVLEKGASVGGAANMRNKTTAFVIVPIISHGRNLPQRVFVLATTTPMIGSLNASKTLATRRMIPIAIALVFRMSWK